MTAHRFRKRPVEVEAVRVTDDPADIADFLHRCEKTAAAGAFQDPASGDVHIGTLEGVMHAGPGDWIVRGVRGELYPVRGDIFEATYEPVED